MMRVHAWWKIVLPLAVIGLLAGYFLLDNSDKDKQQLSTKHAKKEKVKRKAKVHLSQSDKKAQKPKVRKVSIEHPYSPADKQLADTIQTALDEEDFEAVLSAVETALKSSNPDVRHDAVDALGWFGEKALAELTIWMADADEDVAQAAMSHWEEGVSELEDAKERLQVSLYAINTITDKDALEMIGSQFANAATELIDEEEDEKKASQKRTEVVQALVDMIEGDKPSSADAAREIYEDVTGNKWISVDEAEKYLRDPDNYEEPDDE